MFAVLPARHLPTESVRCFKWSATHRRPSLIAVRNVTVDFARAPACKVCAAFDVALIRAFGARHCPVDQCEQARQLRALRESIAICEFATHTPQFIVSNCADRANVQEHTVAGTRELQIAACNVEIVIDLLPIKVARIADYLRRFNVNSLRAIYSICNIVQCVQLAARTSRSNNQR